MIDKRQISIKHRNPNNIRDPSALEKRSLRQYTDETNSSILGFNKLIYHPERLVGVNRV